MPEAKNVKSTR